MNNNRFHYLLFFIFFIHFFSERIPVYAQYYQSQIEAITDEKGHSPSATFAIVEDSLGFIWFGTIDGLYRYDGFNFKIYRHQKNDSNSLTNNTIRDLCLGSGNQLWIATQGGGVSCLNLRTDHFTNFKHIGKDENEVSGNSVWSLYNDVDGNIWMGVSGVGLDKYNVKTQEFSHFPLIQDTLDVSYEVNIRGITQDTSGNIWIGSDGKGLWCLNPKSGKTTAYFPEKSPNSINNDWVYDVICDQEGTIWAATYGGGVNKYNPQSESFSIIQAGQSNVSGLVSNLTYQLLEKEPGELWVGSEYGLSVYRYRTNRFNAYVHDKCNRNTISDNRVRALFVDKNGIVWIGTESGVDKVIEQNRFQLFKNDAFNPNSLPPGIVRSIMEDSEKRLWIGLIDNGLAVYNPNTGKYRTYKHEPGNPKSLPGNHVTAIFQDSGQQVWLGEWDHGLIRYDKTTDSFIEVANAWKADCRLTDNRIQVIHESELGMLWIGTEGGINQYNTHTGEMIHFTHEPQKKSINANGVQSNAFVFDSQGNLWVGMWSHGFNKIVWDSKKTTHPEFYSWKHNPEDTNSINNDNVISMHFSENGILWIGTFGGGLNRFDTVNHTFTHYTEEDGLANNIVFSIFEDAHNNLWMSTDKGISKFDPELEQFKNYDLSYGLQDEHFFWGASYQSISGKIYFGGINGLNGFYPVELERRMESRQNIVLVDIKIVNESIKSSTAIPYLKDISLPYNENFVTFEFSGLDFKEPMKNEYRYILEGVDKNWIQKYDKRFATYTDLNPGEYTFKLNVANGEGDWLHDQLNFRLTILPPWWLTWWARALWILLGAGLFLTFYFLRIRILEKQKKALEQEVAYRTTEISEKNKVLIKQADTLRTQKNAINEQRDELFVKNEQLIQVVEKLEATQKALIESEKMASLGILSAGVAHEIKNPLNFISVSIDTIKMQMEQWGDVDVKTINAEQLADLEKMLSFAETGVVRINKIVNKLRIYASEEVKFEPVIIQELIDEAWENLGHKIPADIIIENKLEELPQVYCHKDQLVQVFINIFDNALYVLENSKDILDKRIKIVWCVTTKSETPWIELDICNSGPSIEVDKIKHLFDPFYTTKPPDMGTGLGLYLSYNIVKEHQGILEARNTEDGVCFKVSFPVIPDWKKRE